MPSQFQSSYTQDVQRLRQGSIKSRDESRATQSAADEGRRKRAALMGQADSAKVNRSMPDAGSHGRYVEKLRLGYNRARQAGVARGRKTRAADRAASQERAQRHIDRKKATSKARYKKEDTKKTKEGK